MLHRLASVALLLIGSSAAGQAIVAPTTQPSVESILARHVEAIGGAAARDAVTTQRMTGTIELPSLDITGELTILVAQPDRIRVTVEFEGLGKVEQGAAAGVGWANDPFSGPRIMAEAERLLLSRSIDAADPLKGFASAVVVGDESVAGRKATRIKFLADAGHEIDEWYAKDTGRLLQRQATWQTDFGPEEQTILYSDYAPVGDSDLLAPKRSEQTFGTNDLVIVLDTMESNVQIPDDAFAPPAAVQELLDRELEFVP